MLFFPMQKRTPTAFKAHFTEADIPVRMFPVEGIPSHLCSLKLLSQRISVHTMAIRGINRPDGVLLDVGRLRVVSKISDKAVERFNHDFDILHDGPPCTPERIVAFPGHSCWTWFADCAGVVVCACLFRRCRCWCSTRSASWRTRA